MPRNQFLLTQKSIIMKNKRFYLPLIVGIMLSFTLFISCEKDDNDEVKITEKELGKATIEGVVYANLNLANDTNDFGSYEVQYERAPAGTKIVATINGGELVSNPDPYVDYGNYIFNTEVEGDGTFSIEVHASSHSANVILRAEDFAYEQQTTDSTTERVVFEANIQSPSVIEDMNSISDIYYTFSK